jgi:REP element-mobilizing transposase RayT
MYTTPLATFMTTTSYGSWLPGDRRGYVDNGQAHPSRRYLNAHVEKSLGKSKVVFSPPEQQRLFEFLQDAAKEFGYTLTDAVVEATHLHWIIGHDDAVDQMAGRLKNRMRQRLDRGRVWTKGYSHRLLFDEDALELARNYLSKHTGVRLLCGRPIENT